MRLIDNSSLQQKHQPSRVHPLSSHQICRHNNYMLCLCVVVCGLRADIKHPIHSFKSQVTIGGNATPVMLFAFLFAKDSATLYRSNAINVIICNRCPLLCLEIFLRNDCVFHYFNNIFHFSAGLLNV